MLRAGVSFAVLMKLLGHVDPGMTMRYVDVTLTDLQREFQLARSKPRHLAPQPKTSPHPHAAGLDGLIDSLVAAQHVMEMFRRSLPNGNARNRAPPALQPPHQDPRRNTKTPHHLNENGQRLAGYGDLPLVAIVVAGQLATINCPTSRWYIENKLSAFLRPLMPAIRNRKIHT